MDRPTNESGDYLNGFCESGIREQSWRTLLGMKRRREETDIKR